MQTRAFLIHRNSLETNYDFPLNRSKDERMKRKLKFPKDKYLYLLYLETGYCFLSEEICRGFVMRETQKAKHLFIYLFIFTCQNVKTFLTFNQYHRNDIFTSTIHLGPEKLYEFMIY